MKASRGLKNADANKFSLRVQKPGSELQKAPLVQLPGNRSKRAAPSKENEVPARANQLVPKNAVNCVVDTAPVTSASESMQKKYSEVGDIDLQSSDSKDCLLVSGYVKDIFTYMRCLEASAASVRPDFLQAPVKLEITPRMRTILVDWLVQVHQRFTLLPETLYLTYHILDAYMSSEAGPGVTKGQFQLVGVSAMLLASKYEEIYPPNVADFVYVTDKAYTAADVLAMEKRLFIQLGFFLGYPLPIQFLRRYSNVAAATPAVHEAAKYFAELARADYTAAHLPPSALAAAAICLARDLLPAPGSQGWSDALEVFSGYGRSQLEPAVRLIAGIAVRAGGNAKYTAIRKKYAGSSASMISTWPELSSDSAMLRAAAGINA